MNSRRPKALVGRSPCTVRLLVALLPMLLCAGLPSAARGQAQGLTPTEMSDIFRRAGQLRVEAQHRLAASCESRTELITVPDVVSPSATEALNGSAPNVTRAGTKTVTLGFVKWTGTCVNGVRDGEGDLIEFSEEAYPGMGLVRNDQVKHGLYVAGRQIGPWRFDKGLSKALEGAYLLYGTPERGWFTRQADGSFQPVQLGSDGKLAPVTSRAPVSAAQIEQWVNAQRQQALATAATPNTPLTNMPAWTTTYTMLQSLTDGARARQASTRELGNTRSKTVLLVLSNQSLQSLKNMDSFRDAVTAWAVAQPHAALREAASNVINMVDKKAFIDGLAHKLRQRFAKVEVAEDLTDMTARNADYALVFDLQFEHHASEVLAHQLKDASKSWSDIQRAYKTPAAQLNTEPAVSLAVSYVLLNPQLEVVRSDTPLRTDIRFSRAHQGSGSDPAVDGLRDALNQSALTLSQYLNHNRQIRYLGQLIDNNANATNGLFRDLDSAR